MPRPDRLALDPHALDGLLADLPGPIAGLTRELLALIAGHPGLTGRVMMGWRSINFRHPLAGHVCAVFPQSERVSLYFEHGRLLQQGEGLLVGEGLKKGRVLRLVPGQALDADVISILLAEAIALFA